MNTTRTLRALVLAYPALGLAACASLAPLPAPGPSAKGADEQDLPKVALENQLLYDILLGEIAAHRGQTGVTADALGRAAQATRDPRLVERATLAAIYARRYDDALRAARLWVELRPNDVEAHEAMATVLLELNDLAQAQTQFEQILASEQQRHNLDQAYQHIAAVLIRQASRPDVVGIMQSLVQRHPRVASGHFALAHLAVRAGDFERAGQAAEQALALRPDWEEAAQFRARILVSQKEMQKAEGFYESFLRQNPGATATRLNYARFLIDQKRWEKALEQFRRIVADGPEDADAIYAVGLLSLQTNRLAEAENYLRLAVRLRPGNDQARIYLGQVAEENKRLAEAEQWYREVRPGEYYFEAQARLGIVLARRAGVEAARRHLRAIQTENDQQRTQLALAEEQILREARLYREALEMLNRAIAPMPGNRDLLYARALIAEKLGLADIAESDLRAILKQDPKNVNALNALGYTLADRNVRLDEARDLLREALALRPDDAFILDSMGWLQYRLGNTVEAVRHLRRALELKSDAEISAHLGEVLWVTGQRKEAELIWDRALRDTPDNEALIGIINKFRERRKE